MTPRHSTIAVDKDHAFDLETAFRKMSLIRTFENTLLEAFSRGELMGTTHTCLGQEANAVGVTAALNGDDVVVSNHRGHGHFLSHVGDVDGLMAEIMGAETGTCGGWGGSQHLAVPGRYYSNGIQGGITPMATGLALAEKMQRSDKLVTVFLGDGTMGEGAVYEALNVAKLRGAPLLIVVENNRIAQTTPTDMTTAGSIEKRFEAFDIPCLQLDVPTADEVYEAAFASIQSIRRGDGPHAIVIDSVRLGPHSKGDDTRDESELKAAHERDPLARTQAKLDEALVDTLWADARARVEEAYRKASEAAPAHLKSAPVSAVSNTQLNTDDILQRIDGKTFGNQINEGLHALLAGDENALVMGEDILDPYGGAFKTSAGLSSAFPDRVLPMPISESAIVGIAGGLALGGMKPVAEMMFGDFLGLAMDQLANHLARYRGMYNGQVSVPAIVRAPMGGRRGYGPTHSQTLDKHFLGLDDLQVLAPSPLHPAADMLERAAGGDVPSLFVENKIAYTFRAERSRAGMVGDFFANYVGDEAAPQLSLSLTEFEDEDATLIVYGGMLPVAMEAAQTLLMDHEVSARIVAPGRLHPLDISVLAAQLAEGGLVVAAEEATSAYGFGAEIAAALAESGALSGRKFARVGALNGTIGAARSLEDEILPQASDLVAAVLERL